MEHTLTIHDIIKCHVRYHEGGRDIEYRNRRTKEVLSKYTAKNYQHELEIDHSYYVNALIKAGVRKE